MCKKKVIIIGGGIGGLFTGAFLSKGSIEVTIVEKNSTIGGGLQSYKRYGEIFDTGMHVVGGMHKNGNLYKICRYLGIIDKINITHVDDDCSEYVYLSSEKSGYKIAKGKDGFVNSLSGYFPHQRQNIENYVNAMISLTNAFDLFYLRKRRKTVDMGSNDFFLPADEFIAKYISDEKLRAVLSFQNLLYAGEAGITPAYIHAIISILYISGVARFVGGTYHFAETLGKLIRNNGGEIITADAVCQVVVEGNKVSHCVTESGKLLKGDYYISAVHPDGFIKLFNNPTVFSKAYRTRIQDMPNTYSAIILNIKLKPNTVEYFNYTGHYLKSISDTWSNHSEYWPNICLFMTPPKENQHKYASTMNIIAPMSWSDVAQWEDTKTGHRGDDYKMWKKKKAAEVIKCMEDIFCNFADCIENIDIATPLTIRDFYGVKYGALYGYKKDCNDMIGSKIPIQTKLSNLFFTGQNHNLHGFCGVALTAIETCNMVLGNDKVLEDIIKVNEEYEA